MTIKARIIRWFLEDSPVFGWLDGYKTYVGNILTVASLVVIAAEKAMMTIGVCPMADWCQYFHQIDAVIALLLSLLVKLVGEWHKKDKQLRNI